MNSTVSFCIFFALISVGSFLVVVGIGFIAMGSAGVFKSSSSSKSSSTKVNDSSIVDESQLNNVSLYPNGSTLRLLSSFEKASDAYALLPINETILSEAIYQIDNTSSIFEAGRKQYLYFRYPNVTSVKRATGEVITNIAIHFGIASQSQYVVTIPIPGANGQTQNINGIVIMTKLVDGSTVLRVEINVPPNVCPIAADGKPRDGCLSISYQAYSVVNGNKITASLSDSVNIACGDVCLLSGTPCRVSCTTCNGEQVAGADTPVSRRYNMGATAATFSFNYETYTVKDRITVWNAGKIIFDTGCVGANGNTSISYSSTTDSIRVDVEPNCACTDPNGCYGTLWHFTVFCLNSKGSKHITISSAGNPKYIHSVYNKNSSILTDIDYIKRISTTN